MKFCKDCSKFRNGYVVEGGAMCAHFPHVVHGFDWFSHPCSLARKEEGLCGMEAKHFEQATPKLDVHPIVHEQPTSVKQKEGGFWDLFFW